MMNSFITIDDISALWKPLDESEKEKVEALIPIVSDLLRQEAKNAGKRIETMLADGTLYPNVLKSVIVDIISRTMMTPTEAAPLSQMSQTGLGYTVQGTFLNPGGGIFIKKSELARLGIRRQQMRMVDLIGDTSERHNCSFASKTSDWC